MRTISERFYVVGISYKKADAATRGLFSISPDNQRDLIKEAVRRGMEGVVVVSTCNRTEIIGFAEHPFKLIELLSAFWHRGTVKEFAEVAYVYKSSEAVEHLFRLTAGLESQILGDYEIVGQLKQAFQLSKSLGGINTHLDKLFSFLMQASKRVKNETRLSSGTTSVSYAAVQYLLQRYGQLTDKTVLLFGLGEIGKNTYKHLLEYARPGRVIIANRSQDKLAPLLAGAPAGVEACRPEEITEKLSKSDIVIVATGAARPTLTERHIPAGHKLTILDLSVPGNVAPGVKQMPAVTVVNIDELSQITDATLVQREQEVPKAEKVIEEVKSEFYDWLGNRKFAPAINTLKEALEDIKARELASYAKRNGTPCNADLDKVTTSLVHKIVRQFARHMKPDNPHASQTVELIYRVFDKENSK